MARLEDPAATLACTKSILVTTHGSKKEGKALTLLQDLLMDADDIRQRIKINSNKSLNQNSVLVVYGKGTYSNG
jgi:hypothetical protein